MKFIFDFCFLRLVWLALAFGAVSARASNSGPAFLLSAYNLTTNNVVYTNTTVTTVITVSNLTGVTLTNTYVTNEFSAAVIFGTVTNYDTNNFATNDVIASGDTVVFSFQYFVKNGVVHMTLPWQPQTAGPITNTVVVVTPDILTSGTNLVSTNLVNPVYAVDADLGVSLSFVSQAYVTNYWVITNDWLTYKVTVTNAGPQSAAGIILTNTLPANVILRSAPSGYATVASNLQFNVGTLASGAAASYQFTIQPTNSGAYALTATVGATNVSDPNLANNAAVTNVTATAYLAATLTAGTNSGQTLDLQNGLVEQTIQVTNNGATAVPAVRVVVSGLTNELFNAGGTNYLQPFVTYPLALAAGAHAGLVLQYFPRPSRIPFPFNDGQLQVYAVPAKVLNYAPYADLQSSPSLNPNGIFLRKNGVLLEFPSVAGRSYTVVYSDNLQFSNAMIAPPVYVAPANYVQWLDYGPPATVSPPASTTNRFYRVYLNP